MTGDSGVGYVLRVVSTARLIADLMNEDQAVELGRRRLIVRHAKEARCSAVMVRGRLCDRPIGHRGPHRCHALPAQVAAHCSVCGKPLRHEPLTDAHWKVVGHTGSVWPLCTLCAEEVEQHVTRDA